MRSWRVWGTCLLPLSAFPSAVKHSGNVTLDQIIDVARIMRPRSLAKSLTGTVKEILGTAFRCGLFFAPRLRAPLMFPLLFFFPLCSVGCTVNGVSPGDIQKRIDDGEIEIPSA